MNTLIKMVFATMMNVTWNVIQSLKIGDIVKVADALFVAEEYINKVLNPNGDVVSETKGITLRKKGGSRKVMDRTVVSHGSGYYSNDMECPICNTTVPFSYDSTGEVRTGIECPHCGFMSMGDVAELSRSLRRMNVTQKWHWNQTMEFTLGAEGRWEIIKSQSKYIKYLKNRQLDQAAGILEPEKWLMPHEEKYLRKLAAVEQFRYSNYFTPIYMGKWYASWIPELVKTKPKTKGSAIVKALAAEEWLKANPEWIETPEADRPRMVAKVGNQLIAGTVEDDLYDRAEAAVAAVYRNLDSDVSWRTSTEAAHAAVLEAHREGYPVIDMVYSLMFVDNVLADKRTLSNWSSDINYAVDNGIKLIDRMIAGNCYRWLLDKAKVRPEVSHVPAIGRLIALIAFAKKNATVEGENYVFDLTENVIEGLKNLKAQLIEAKEPIGRLTSNNWIETQLMNLFQDDPELREILAPAFDDNYIDCKELVEFRKGRYETAKRLGQLTKVSKHEFKGFWMWGTTSDDAPETQAMGDDPETIVDPTMWIDGEDGSGIWDSVVRHRNPVFQDLDTEMDILSQYVKPGMTEDEHEVAMGKATKKLIAHRAAFGNETYKDRLPSTTGELVARVAIHSDDDVNIMLTQGRMEIDSFHGTIVEARKQIKIMMELGAKVEVTEKVTTPEPQVYYGPSVAPVYMIQMPNKTIKVSERIYRAMFDLSIFDRA